MTYEDVTIIPPRKTPHTKWRFGCHGGRKGDRFIFEV